MPAEIIKIMKGKGYKGFGMHQHTQLWKLQDAKNENKGFGVQVANTWYWYDNWIKEVEKYCLEHKEELIK